MGIHRTPRKGTLNAPDEILEDFNFERNVMVEEVFTDEFDLEETHRRIRENTEELLQYGKPIVSLGGDHSVSFPVISALKEEYPGMKLVWLDSHLDLKEKVDGNVSHDTVVRELLDQFSKAEIYFVGITRIDGDEKEFLEGKDLNIYGPGELEEFLREFNPGEQPVYLSIDIDVLEGIGGTGYPDGELEKDDVRQIIKYLRPQFADLVEVAPPLDEGETVKNARQILSILMERIDHSL